MRAITLKILAALFGFFVFVLFNGKVFAGNFTVVSCDLPNYNNIDGKKIESTRCAPIQKEDLFNEKIQRFGNITELCMPELDEKNQVRIAQFYEVKNGKPYDDGHNGLDISGSDPNPNYYVIKSVAEGLVIVSENNPGWGETIIVATPVNDFSEEVITFDYHHLFFDKTKNTSTRRFNAGEIIHVCDKIGMEGSTGNSNGSHLHFGVRRWANVAELNLALQSKLPIQNYAGESYPITHGGYPLPGIYSGKGYYTVSSYFFNMLDPEGVLFDTYEIYGNDKLYDWALTYAVQMRKLGVDFGLWDGSFGFAQNVKRREAARWIKIAAGRVSWFKDTPIFNDVPKTDPDYPYINSLAAHIPFGIPSVINADVASGKFSPNDYLNRAQVIKMVVLAFYLDQFLDWLDDLSAHLETYQAASVFDDVSVSDWFAPYVIFGLEKGLVAQNTSFHPGQNVVRAEMAKWIIEGYEVKHSLPDLPCGQVCSAGKYCKLSTHTCEKIPSCIPTESLPCEVGGSNCTDGETTACGLCGTSTCSNGQFGACQNEGVCSPGENQSQSCNGNGTQSRNCGNNCQWGTWGNCSQNAPTCNDGIQNQGETGVDCGGPCVACPAGGSVDLATGLAKPYDLALDTSSVYWVEYLGGTLRKVAKNGGSVTTLASGLLTPSALTIANGYVYVLEYNAGSGYIKRVSTNGGSIESVVSNLQSAQNHLVQDGMKLFFCAYDANLGGTVKSVPLGSNQPATTIVTGLQQSVSAIEVDTNYVYFSDGNNQIMRSNKDGSNLVVLGIGIANSIRVNNTKIFYTGGFSFSVNSMPINGGIETVLTPGITTPLDLALDAGRVYWIEESNGAGVSSIPFNGGANKNYSLYGNSLAIEVDASYVYWAEYFQANQGKIRRAPK